MIQSMYETFEDRLQRWKSAADLVEKIAAEIKIGRSPWESDWNPSDTEINSLIHKWIPDETVVCQNEEAGAAAPCPGPASCGRRCSTSYWLMHGEDVAASMSALAMKLDQDPQIWLIAGRIHDIDYPKNPHHSSGVSSEQAHPLKVANFLFNNRAAPALVLAILSHAPHLRLRPSSPLAWALLACDEHATMTGFSKQNLSEMPVYPENLQSLAVVLRPARSTIGGGFRRSDMNMRAALGLHYLTAFKAGKIPQFDMDRFKERINWSEEAGKVL